MSNYSFCNYLRKVICEDALCGRGACEMGFAGSSEFPGPSALSYLEYQPPGELLPACRNASHSEQGESISPPLFLHLHGGRVELLSSRRSSTADFAGRPLPQGSGDSGELPPPPRPHSLPACLPAILVLSRALVPVLRRPSLALESDPRALRD